MASRVLALRLATGPRGCRVVLAADVADAGIHAGDEGTIVEITDSIRVELDSGRVVDVYDPALLRAKPAPAPLSGAPAEDEPLSRAADDA